MRIQLKPLGSSDTLAVSRQGSVLVINGKAFDFGQVPDGATLPAAAVSCAWLAGPVERVAGQLQITLLLPHLDDAPAAARFPVDILNPPDGQVLLPTGASEANEVTSTGVVDWSQMVTQEMKAQATADRHLAEVVAETAARRSTADAAMAPLQDAVDIDDVTEAELAALKAWKKYRVALIRLPDQAGYPATIDWPVAPA
ncbi:tail fiber assembly protein [Pseudomonas wadenswilerensis]|uniref:tail fiber assembly protein n=1 Tax=Pseudomonas wadenswilerensis TaxID=1785161 RepID=UPI00215E181A|nr:tail fiber assembly protein [Pseudomonas wadenswilerensis]UVM23814.1 tail fiber assembly protein [Pseudomonas wadenswilerensis]